MMSEGLGVPATRWGSKRNKRLLSGLGNVYIDKVTRKTKCAERKRCKSHVAREGEYMCKLIYYYIEIGHRHKWICLMCARAVLIKFIEDLSIFQARLLLVLNKANALTYGKHHTLPDAERARQHREEEE